MKATDSTIRMQDSFYILATDSTAFNVNRVLKSGDSFAVFDSYGDIQSGGRCQEGFYHQGTRFLSQLVFKLGNARPFLLSSMVKKDNLLLVVNLTNPDVYQGGDVVLARGTLHITRAKLLWQAACYETLRIINYGLSPVEIQFSIDYGADFADVFEVRGMTRQRRGRQRENQRDRDTVLFAYDGLDGVARRTRMHCFPAPSSLSATAAKFTCRFAPMEGKEFSFTYSCEIDDAITPRLDYTRAYAQAEAANNALQTQDCQVVTSNEQFNQWLNRSSADLRMMFTATPAGFYPYAGVPWFSTAFGRDGIITAFEYLWVNPRIARAVLGFLASLQAREVDPQRDAEPGKILHETRKGEMAALKEIPFDLYYGSVDATPLFVMLAGAYLEATHDVAFIQSIWPNIDNALRWLDEYGDRDEDGLIEYARYSHKGLVHQGWKDSWDAVSHQDGSLAAGPIALCEVQGYAYAARLAGASIAAELGDHRRFATLSAAARRLKEEFEESFWSEEMGTYVLALDGEKHQCRVRSSNAGHCLFSGIADEGHARSTAQVLMADDSFAGWGIRTLAASEARFNPMAYHNGSVWPHDNAIVAAGLARYGYKEEACKILTGLFEASLFMEYRLPELFCGFARREGEGPVPYPVACSPQSWSAAGVFALLQAVLGMKVNAGAARLSFIRPALPEFLDRLEIKNLPVGSASLDLLIQRRNRSAIVEVNRREGPVEVITEA